MKVQDTFEVAGVATDPTSWKVSDALAAYGVKETLAGTVIVADNTALTKLSTGVYEIEFTATEGLSYTVAWEIIYAGQTIRHVFTVTGLGDGSADGYITLAECDAYALRVADITAWTGASESQRSAAVNQATDQIDALRLAGEKYDEDQVRQFPRFAPDDIAMWPAGKTIRSGQVWDYDDDAAVAIVPADVKLACFLQALSILRDGPSRDERLRDRHDGVTGQSGGGFSESYVAGQADILCLEAQRLMEKYLIHSARIV